MNPGQVNEYNKKLFRIELSEQNIEYYTRKAIEQMEIYDSLADINNPRRLEALTYIVSFFNSYINYKCGVNCRFSFGCRNNTGVVAWYSPRDDAIFYNWDVFIFDSSIGIIETIFHEYRHKLQNTDYKKDQNDLITMDPMAIFMLKERFVMKDHYKNNHSSFIIENDANLWAYTQIKKLKIPERIPDKKSVYENRIARLLKSGEMCNFATSFYNSTSPAFGDEEYKHKYDGTLPIFLEIDMKFKDYIKSTGKSTLAIKQLLVEYPILRLIINDNGTFKSYEELMEEKKKLLNKYANSQVSEEDTIDSFNSYEGSWGIRTGEKQINAIYSIIIKSDPILYLEDCFYNNRASHMIIKFLEGNPSLLENKEYSSQIYALFEKYISLENGKRLLSRIEKSYIDANSKEKIKNIINYRVRVLAIRTMVQKLHMKVHNYYTDNVLDNGKLEIKPLPQLQHDKTEKLITLKAALNKGMITEKEYESCVIVINNDYSQKFSELTEQETMRNKGNGKNI